MAGEIQGDAGLASVVVTLPNREQPERYKLSAAGNTFFVVPADENHCPRDKDDDCA